MPPGFYTNLYGYEKALKSALAKNVISKSDFDLINEYLVEKQARDQIGARRSDRIVSSLITIRRFTQCDFNDVSASDLYSALSRMKEPDSHNGRPYSENTIYTHVRVLKMFWRWMIDEGYSEIPLKKISAIKSPNFSTDTTRPDDVVIIGCLI